jgi:tetratricopeptide (TPR) repeat protein
VEGQPALAAIVAVGVCSRAVMLMALVLAVSPFGQASASASRAEAVIQRGHATPATAELEEAAKAFARGVAAFKQERYEDALTEFSRAQELAPHPDTLFNLGLALQKTHRHVEAWRSFEALLPQARDEQEREDILTAQAVSRPHVAWLRVLVEPDDVVVCLDGEVMPVGEHGGHALLTTPGSHRLDVDRQRRTLELEGGESRTVELTVTPPAAPPPPRRTLRALAGLAIGGAGAATGAGLGAAFVTEPPPARLGLGLGAAAAGSLAVASTVAALVVHRRARRWKPPEPLRRCPR